MKVTFEIRKEHLSVIILVLTILAGIGMVTAVDTSKGWHPWSQIECTNCITRDHIADSVEAEFDKKCDAAGNCAQVCIGNDCKSAWSTGTLSCTRRNSDTSRSSCDDVCSRYGEQCVSAFHDYYDLNYEEWHDYAVVTSCGTQCYIQDASACKYYWYCHCCKIA